MGAVARLVGAFAAGPGQSDQRVCPGAFSVLGRLLPQRLALPGRRSGPAPQSLGVIRLIGSWPISVAAAAVSLDSGAMDRVLASIVIRCGS